MKNCCGFDSSKIDKKKMATLAAEMKKHAGFCTDTCLIGHRFDPACN